MSSTIPKTQARSRRQSKFVEGSPATGADLLQRTPTSNELFLNILSEMDEFERRKRRHRGSSSSVDSLASSNPSPVKETVAEGRRSGGFARPNMDAFKKPDDTKSHKIVGRLRALTSGQKEKGTPYPGT